jgi:hypothetical protein
MCDLNGTFATLNEIDVEWTAVSVLGITVIAAGSDTVFSWGIRQITVTNGSTVQVDSVPCGGTAPDLCSPYYKQSFADAIPTSIWQGANIPFGSVTTTITDPDPGEAFVTPTEAGILGVTLGDPLGTWPNAWNAAGLTWAGPTSTSTPPDQDGDGQYGITSYFNNTGTSSVCSQPYADLPDPNSPLSGPRIDRVYTGSRVLGGYNGTIVAKPAASDGLPCDVMTGTLTGPTNGFPEIDGRVRGCHLDNGTACSDTTWQDLDAQGNTAPQTITATHFSMVRVADSGITCAAVRAMSFP